MKFKDKGFLLNKNKYNENSAIAEFSLYLFKDNK